MLTSMAVRSGTGRRVSTYAPSEVIRFSLCLHRLCVSLTVPAVTEDLLAATGALPGEGLARQLPALVMAAVRAPEPVGPARVSQIWPVHDPPRTAWPREDKPAVEYRQRNLIEAGQTSSLLGTVSITPVTGASGGCQDTLRRGDRVIGAESGENESAFVASSPGGGPRQIPKALQTGLFRIRASSPMTPRRKVRTQTTKIAPCTTVTQPPSWAR